MEDGAPAHHAMTTQRWHEDYGVKGFEGLSPHLNPIENLSSQLNLQL